MYEKVSLIRLSITVAVSFLMGYLAALWVTHLDPDVTGGASSRLPPLFP